MRTIIVHPRDPQVDAHTLTSALQQARSGDVVLLSPGTYSPENTGEILPLHVPPGVVIEGAGAEFCIIDGEGQFTPSFDPIRPDLSTVVLDDGAQLRGVAVVNSGGHGIGVPPGASVVIDACALHSHGDHGLFLCGVNEAIVTRCIFENNGRKRFEPALSRGAGARQGHHIFAEARHGQQNRLILTDNVMRNCFADGIAFVCFFSQPDGVSFSALVARNTIVESERGGLLFSSSFGPAHNRLRVVALDNTLKSNKQFGISLLGAVPLARPIPHDNLATALIAGNNIEGSPVGILVQSAVNETYQNRSEVIIDRNRISAYGKQAIRLVGAVGATGMETAGNVLEAVVSRNTVTGNTPAVVSQGGSGASSAILRQNTVRVRFVENTSTSSQDQAFLLSDGQPGCAVEVSDGSDAITRTEQDLLT